MVPNEIFNPHQNININISYNVPTEKSQQIGINKKMNQMGKLHQKNKSECEVPKNYKKVNDNRKINELKKTAQKKKLQKKLPMKNNTIISQPERKYKVDMHNLLTQPNIVSHKKQNRISNKSTSTHHYSAYVNLTRKKKGKTSQYLEKKKNHATSCILQSQKKPIVDLTNSSNLGLHQVHHKRRVQSATIMKNDKIVSKILNMSLLASELGSSQIITSERKSNSVNPIKSLRQFMNSIDIKILKNIRQDTPICIHKSICFDPILTHIMVSKHINEDVLVKKVCIIQRIWRNRKQRNIVNYYKNLFKKVTNSQQQKKQKSQNNNEIEQIPSLHLINSSRHQSFQSQQNQLQQQKLSKQHFYQQQQSISQKQIIRNKQNPKLYDINLNLSKYKQLVCQEKINLGDQKKGLQKFKQQQAEQWNNINKMISINMNQKGNVNSNTLLEELIKQSKLNKKWIENQVNHSNKISIEYSQQSEEQMQNIQQLNQNNNFYQNTDSLDEQQQELEYDRKKYSGIGNTQQDNNSSDDRNRKDNFNIDHDELDYNNDEKYIVQQMMMDDQIVKQYLNCGLGSFGINAFVNQSQKRTNLSNNNNTLHYDCNITHSINKIFDEIDEQTPGNKFIQEQQHSNNKHCEKYKSIIENNNNEILGDCIINLLISQFANDMSYILKKNTRNITRKQGILTNFNSITQYINKLQKYIIEHDKSQQIIANLNHQIGPQSLLVLQYLRTYPINLYSEDLHTNQSDLDQQEQQEGVFVIPAVIFDELEQYLQIQNQKDNYMKTINNDAKACINLWHRSIFQCYNQCLQEQRAYGPNGKPYQWLPEIIKPRWATTNNIHKKLQLAKKKLFQITSYLVGIIFEKQDSPFGNVDLLQEHKHQINQQRLSKMLTNQLFQSQLSWLDYNDQIAQELVQLSHKLQEQIYEEVSQEIKNIFDNKTISPSQNNKQ